MKQDIRDLFTNKEDLKTLPDNHRAEFLEKLKSQPKKNSNYIIWIRVAATVIIALAIGYSQFYKQSNEVEPPVISQIKAVEDQYLKDIEKEWQSFVAVANDEALVARFKKRLNELDADYQEIAAQFQNDANNIEIIEALVDNLQTRLQILRDIQEHINILNQKNEQNEITI